MQESKDLLLNLTFDDKKVKKEQKIVILTKISLFSLFQFENGIIFVDTAISKRGIKERPLMPLFAGKNSTILPILPN